MHKNTAAFQILASSVRLDDVPAESFVSFDSSL